MLRSKRGRELGSVNIAEIGAAFILVAINGVDTNTLNSISRVGVLR